MRPRIDKSQTKPLIWTAPETDCPACQRKLAIAQHRTRYVIRLDHIYRNVRRDKHCTQPDCPKLGVLYRPLEDIRLALPFMNYGLDLVLRVGEEHVHRNQSLRQIHRDLPTRELKPDQSHMGELLRAYLALCQASQQVETRRAQLLKQGGIMLMVDGVQYDNRSPVVYVCWDAMSGTVLCSERQLFRGEKDLEPLLMQVKAMGVPLIGVATDKDTGLVPAVRKVFPQVPHQFCQTHFLKNCAEGMEEDLKALGESVERRADKVREVEKRIHKAEQKEQAAARKSGPARGAEAEPPRPAPPGGQPSPPGPLEAADGRPSPPAPLPPDVKPLHKTRPVGPPSPPGSLEAAPAGLSDKELATQFCALIRHNARVSGRAIMSPAQMERHRRLEQIRTSLDAVRKKRPRRPRSWTLCPRRSSPTGTRPVPPDVFSAT